MPYAVTRFVARDAKFLVTVLTDSISRCPFVIYELVSRRMSTSLYPYPQNLQRQNQTQNLHPKDTSQFRVPTRDNWA